MSNSSKDNGVKEPSNCICYSRNSVKSGSVGARFNLVIFVYSTQYFRFFDAAVALEDCLPEYKAIFAQARPSGPPSRTSSGGGHNNGPAYSNSGPPAMMGAEYLPPPKQAIQNILMPLPDQVRLDRSSPNLRYSPEIELVGAGSHVMQWGIPSYKTRKRQ